MEWISVKDRLPKLNERVLTHCPYDGIKETWLTTYRIGSIGYSRGERKKWFEYVHENACYHHDATHWMPLPEPPKP